MIQTKHTMILNEFDDYVSDSNAFINGLLWVAIILRVCTISLLIAYNILFLEYQIADTVQNNVRYVTIDYLTAMLFIEVKKHAL